MTEISILPNSCMTCSLSQVWHTHLQFSKWTQQSCPVGLHFAILSTHTELNGEPVDLRT